MNEDRAAEGLDHLQRAAREMVAAARSFLDVMEDLVEDRAALAEAAATVTGLTGAVTDAVRSGLAGRGGFGPRPEPWEEAAWGEPPFEDPAPFEDAAPEPESAPGAVDGDGADVVDVRGTPGRPSRVRRIAVD